MTSHAEYLYGNESYFAAMEERTNLFRHNSGLNVMKFRKKNFGCCFSYLRLLFKTKKNFGVRSPLKNNTNFLIKTRSKHKWLLVCNLMNT